MITLSVNKYDLQGDVILFPNRTSTELGSFNRRHTRTATLDGGSDYTDLGFSHSDMVFSYEVEKITQEQIDTLIYLITNYSLITLTNKEGVFQGSLAGLNINAIPIVFDFLPVKKTSA